MNTSKQQVNNSIEANMKQTKWTHYVMGTHYKDSGMIRDIGKPEFKIDGDIDLSGIESIKGVTLISKDGKTKYVETFDLLITPQKE